MKNIFSKIISTALIAALGLAALPVTNVLAADDNPPAPSNERLERVWARQMRIYERTGKAFEDTDAHIARFQELIDKADENGKDVSSLQATLDAYADALTKSRPAYDALGEIMSAHEGFDADGKVTDSEAALATVKEAGKQMKSLKDSMDGSLKALHEALKAFRKANRPANNGNS